MPWLRGHVEGGVAVEEADGPQLEAARDDRHDGPVLEARHVVRPKTYQSTTSVSSTAGRPPSSAAARRPGVLVGVVARRVALVGPIGRGPQVARHEARPAARIGVLRGRRPTFSPGHEPVGRRPPHVVLRAGVGDAPACGRADRSAAGRRARSRAASVTVNAWPYGFVGPAGSAGSRPREARCARRRHPGRVVRRRSAGGSPR